MRALHEAWFLITAFPAASLAVSILILAGPLMLARVRGLVSDWPAPARWYGRAIVGIAVVGGIVLAARYLAVAAPLVEGVDFYYQALTARDCLLGAPPAPADRYVYFPGGWRIWQGVMAVFGVRLGALQWAFVALLVANVALVSAIIAKVSGRPLVAFAAGLWYLGLSSKLEGLEATTEPLTTLFVLAGLLAWAGERLEGRSGAWRAVALGAGLGMAAWTKQQGILPAAGFLALVLSLWPSSRKESHSVRLVVAVPATASAVFFALILLEGQGLLPIRTGLSRVHTYEMQGSFVDNARVMWVQAGWLGWMTLFAFGAWMVVLVVPRFRRVVAEPWFGVLGFCVLAGAASMIQFTRRSYLHYALITAPFMAIAAGVMVARAYDALPVRFRQGTLASSALAFLLVLPLLGGRYASHFHAWPPTENSGVARRTLWHARPALSEDLRVVRTLVPSGSQLVVLPQRRNAIHFLLETHAPTYRWGGLSPADVVRSPGVEFVLVLDPGVLDEADLAEWSARGTGEAVASLESLGFDRVARLATMSVWRMKPPE